jgi:hypothetical protein
MANPRYSQGMVIVLFGAGITAGVMVGLVFGYGLSQVRSQEAKNVRRYRDAIALLRTLIITPDAVDLRPQAQSIIAAHEAAEAKRKK